MLRLVSHPIGRLPSIPPRAVVWRPELDSALVDAPGTEPLRARLREPGALVVTTGQQPGLFTGPLYTVHKALSAAALAMVLERRWKRPVVPLFWIAGDDHDYAEASSATWVDQVGTLIDWHLPPRPVSAPQLPMYQVSLPADILVGLEQLGASLPPGPRADEVLDWLGRHYLPGRSIHHAFAGALAELLAPVGVLCFDPTCAAAKRAQAPILAEALRQASALDQVLAALPEPGTGIATGEDASLVFMTSAAGRDRLMIDGPAFRTRRSGERFTLLELESLLQREPERFSANVLLRPVVEAALLPTVAYAAGPAEERYLDKQSIALYARFDVVRQVPVPRWSGTVIAPWAERLLERLGIDAGQVLHDDGALARTILERDFPADARQALDALTKQIARSAGVVGAAGKRIDPVLVRAIAGRMQRLNEITEQIDSSLQRHLRRRTNIAHAQYQRLLQGLRPRGNPQERILINPVFLGRFGAAWLNAVYDAAQRWADALPQAAE
ncbi:MAG TPA: bacillithiol biosynthesis cysteine-adding enzyme BshC [Gemmatimonadales bacterium]